MVFDPRARRKHVFEEPRALSEVASKIWLQPPVVEDMFDAGADEGAEMFAVQDDWIQYEAVPARRAAVRGGAVCAQRVPVVRRAAPRPAAPVLRAAATARDLPARPTTAVRRLRLTRRGRFVLVVLPGLLALSGALLALSGTPAAEAAPRPAVTRTVVVESGDSLWAIAERADPGRDPRAVVADLQRLNGLAGPTVPAGAVLRLPAS